MSRADAIGGLELWLFGSAKYSLSPRDLDVLVIYEDVWRLEAIRQDYSWDLASPPIDLIAMMPDEAAELGFVKVTQPVRLA